MLQLQPISAVMIPMASARAYAPRPMSESAFRCWLWRRHVPRRNGRVSLPHILEAIRK